MIVHTVRVPYRYGETIRILLLSDLHAGNEQCDMRAAKSKLADDPEAYIVTNGDLADCVVLQDIKPTDKHMEVWVDLGHGKL